jgi:hypothetical protein
VGERVEVVADADRGPSAAAWTGGRGRERIEHDVARAAVARDEAWASAARKLAR